MKFILLLSAVSILAYPVKAQEYELSMDLLNRYVWRGIELASAASVQPGLGVSIGDFSVGSWASYALSPQTAGSDEHDFWASYAVDRFSFTVTDYYYPHSANNDFFDFEDNGLGAHVLEAALGFDGGDDFPLTFLLAANFYNDQDNSLYLELGWKTSSGMGLVAGFAKGESAWYGLTGSGVQAINVGVSYTRELKFNDEFKVPLSGQVIVNPALKMSYFVVGLSL